ncbi:class I SAM-dependent methyltransferase [Streptomyces sp. NPDC049954]|uniref:class I SAM-dependent DNA methyltransferase n=1 Tax=Streptomyces sp. NPDC049954 TaxID=3155779 RepID=UPI003434D11E
MLDYDREAERYDGSRGGLPRARAAAEALDGLLPGHHTTVLDLACGTGIVGGCLRERGRTVLGVDLSAGMLARAGGRLDAVVRADARALPFADASVPAVTAVWLLNLLDDAAPVIAEAARVLRPGGVFVTTVDKAAAHAVDSDIDALIAPYRPAELPDGAGRVTALAAAEGLRPVRTARFTGHGQGRTPLALAARVREGSLYAEGGVPLAERLEALPDPSRPRAEPTFTFLALRRRNR